jgi:hypothetical protein
MAEHAWGNPTWVLAVMCYPHEHVLLERIAREQETLLRPETERAIQAEAVRAGKVAGNVLAVLYTLATSPWRIDEPSFARAVHIAEKLAIAESAADAAHAARHRRPRGHTKIEACYNAMRPVAHLWAAFRLHWEFPTRAHEDLFNTAEGVHALLRIARGVQNFARTWAPARTHPRQPPIPLLGESPWLIPDEITPLYPPWADKPTWLLNAGATYKRRSR